MSQLQLFLQYWRANGTKTTLKRLFQFGDPKYGYLRGVDRWGNEYYEHPEQMFGRERWVILQSGTRWDASEIPAEWHAWMHRMNDSLPSENPPELPIFHLAVRRNPTGTNGAHTPPGSFLNRSPPPLALTKKYESWRPYNLRIGPSGRPMPAVAASKAYASLPN
eukprot:TRINITY_DN247_c0_g1_i1.p1 TRINITY_DN247_c0_g1~~TRINITY_DN247_c0_g1_i1.p1  ORF type:complete len:164 (+),score=29.44 TRINITY_DN247_c0_g1_i1:68-559(+)